MRVIFLIVFLVGLTLIGCEEACEKKTTNKSPEIIEVALEIPDTTVNLSKLQYDKMKSLYTLNDQLYSGYSVSYFQNNVLKEKVGILNGRRQNQMISWYPDGHFRQTSHYHKGKLHGEKKKWASDTTHKLIALLNYQSGKTQGEQKLWYPTGEFYKKLHMNEGREEGMQQAFRKNGVLYANYEAKKGRTFGLKKAALCFGLDDENVKYEK